jgi:hypothetical protein
MANQLSQEMRKLLGEIVCSRRPDLLGLLDLSTDTKLTEEQREDLRLAVADELLETGLQENDEPNKRGLLLDELISRLGHL